MGLGLGLVSRVRVSNHALSLQPVSGGLQLHEGRGEPKLWLHQLRHVRLGLPRPLQTHDPRLLGEPLPAGP